MTFLQAVREIQRHIQNIQMYKAGSDQNGAGLSYIRVTGMAATEDTDPDHVISNGIVIPDDWPDYTAVVYGQVKWNGGSNPKVGCRLRRNGSDLITGAIVTNSSNVAFASTTITVVGGDSFEMFWQGDGSFLIRPNCLASPQTFMRVTPT